MIRKLLTSRAARKFRRNRLAVLALFVIALYGLVGLSVIALDLLPESVTGHEQIAQHWATERVGLNHEPGFFRTPSIDKRANDTQNLYAGLDRILNSRSERPTEELLAEWDGRPGWRITETDPDKVREGLDHVAEYLDEWEELADEHELDQGEVIPELIPVIEQAESALNELIEPDSSIFLHIKLLCGTDSTGRSILMRALYSIKVALEIGFVTGFVSVLFGSLLGAAAAFFGGWVDGLVIWLYSTFSSIPNLVMLTLLAFVFMESRWGYGLLPVYIAFCMTYWIGPCRVTRGEVMKLKELEYVQAATAIGFGRLYIMLKHILPNTAHLMFVNFSLLFIGAIKGEVILSYLGLGVKNGASWGVMIGNAKPEVVNNFFWQIGTATAFMFVLVLAFNILTDALQDALDPKHAG